MIDSVVLQLNSDQFKLSEYHKFDGNRTQRGIGFGVNSDYCSAYIKQQKDNGIYCPQVELPKRKNSEGEMKETLEIQVSLPKLVHGTNLMEIDKNDLSKIYEKLLSFLNEVGVTTSIDEIKKAIVKRVDFSKLVKLPDYLGRANKAIYALWRFNYKQNSDFDFKEFYDGSEGLCMKFWNLTQGYAIYDKFSELLSNGYTTKELEIVELFKSGRYKRNVIKFELSLQRKGSLEAFLRRRIKTKKKDFLLEDILDKDLANDILKDTFEKVFNNLTIGLVSLADMENNRLLAFLDNPKLKTAQQEKLFYWVNMVTSFGIAGAWEQLEIKYKGGSISRQKKEIAFALQELGTISGNIPNLIGFLREEHNRLEPPKPT